MSRREQEGEAQLTSNAQHVHDFREEISLQRGHQSESIRMLKGKKDIFMYATHQFYQKILQRRQDNKEKNMGWAGSGRRNHLGTKK